MANPTLGLFSAARRANWVRLRTITTLRWIAIAGQVTAIFAAQRLFELDLPIGYCLMVVGVAAIANLVAMFVYPENKRLNEFEIAGHLVFDIVQLCLLLILTGGLNNPFALLILVPVTISATALNLRPTIVLGALAIWLVTGMIQMYVPLQTQSGGILQQPPVFIFGYWVAIVLGVIFLAAFAQRITSEIHAMADALSATQMALEREQKLTDLGGVVAAAAHELGTPLATIKLVSKELEEELLEEPELLEDVKLIGAQADRCRDILHSMGRAGKDDRQLKQVPLGALVHEAAEPHEGRGIEVIYDISPLESGVARQPTIFRRPEIVHGLRNLIQNAVDFANTTVWIDVHWTADRIIFRVTDDGPGYPVSVLSRIGDPFVRLRRSEAAHQLRPEYAGMGLGLFIAKTLLERSGAELVFANARDPYDLPAGHGERSGAVVSATWPERAIAVRTSDVPTGLGANERFEAG